MFICVVFIQFGKSYDLKLALAQVGWLTQQGLVIVSVASSLLRVGLLAGVVNTAVITLESNGMTDCFPINSHTQCFFMEMEFILTKQFLFCERNCPET